MNIYTLVNYKGNGEVQGSFSSINKAILFLKETCSTNIGYTSDDQKYLGVGMMKPSEKKHILYLKDLNDDNENTTFRVFVSELNPTLEREGE
jgi:hypothetical protein